MVAKQNPIVSPEVSRKIIEDYKASEDFHRELVEGSTDGFFKGFELCQSQILNILPNFDVSLLKEFPDKDDDDEVEVEEGEINEVEGESAEVDEAENIINIEEKNEAGEVEEKEE